MGLERLVAKFALAKRCPSSSSYVAGVVVVSWCCESPNDVTFRPFCVSHYHKVQVFSQPLQILFSTNECKISVSLSVPTNSLTTFDLIKQGFN